MSVETQIYELATWLNNYRDNLQSKLNSIVDVEENAIEKRIYKVKIAVLNEVLAAIRERG